MDLSFLIVNWNTCRYLRRCLRSIRETVKGVAYEVIVTDNASSDGSAEMVRNEFPEVHLIAESENGGFAHGNNLAFGRSSGWAVLVMNPDVELLEGTAEGLLEFARSHPEAGVLSPKLLNPDRSLQNYYGRIPTLATIFFLYTAAGKWIDRRLLGNRMRKLDRYERHGDFREVLWLTDGGAGFCCTLIPRHVVQRIGFMDERFPVFFNDGDFGVRLFQAGYKACILPDVHACHHGGASVRQLDSLAYNQEYVYGMRAFYRKHRGLLYRRAVDLALASDVPVRFARVLQEVLGRRKPLWALSEPFRFLLATFAYRPANARDLVYRVPTDGVV
ncbi:MAG: glycosyltransferase family 2 protein [bacterium]